MDLAESAYEPITFEEIVMKFKLLEIVRGCDVMIDGRGCNITYFLVKFITNTTDCKSCYFPYLLHIYPFLIVRFSLYINISI